MKKILLQLKVPLGACLFLAMSLLFLPSCKKDDVYRSDIFIKKQWKLNLSSTNVIPALANKDDHAVAMVYLMSNKELHYDIYFDRPLENGDSPTTVKLYFGESGQTGELFLDLNAPSFNAQRETKGKVLLDEPNFLKIQTAKIYCQVSSTQQQSGLVRDQLN
ncbi:CHRD domain-containing protein [Pedobacter insulae]|uniref:CHRD domain-containing protein n=1 Tax=Pedobacter insulae TaxID=414048 RepID=A0A1I2VU53_9SPHI|nr:CHRD domain-containing protein [Pedobacter insulae]SFG91979.1 CHRD domain-containing protein [Pedobacter insulae]